VGTLPWPQILDLLVKLLDAYAVAYITIMEQACNESSLSLKIIFQNTIIYKDN
jgi:hypothetical protein